VRVFIEIPRKLDEEQKELLRKFEGIENKKSGNKSFYEKISSIFSGKS
jgi:DnaJ-class molecular chaperone